MYYNNSEQQLISKLNKIKSLNLNKCLNIFENLYHTHYLRETAKNLNISLGSVSTTIKTLENVLEANLFERKGKNGMSPTTAATNLHSYAKQFILTINSIGENFNLNSNNHRIYIVCHMLAAQKYIFPAIKSFNTEINFKINSHEKDECIKQLVSGEADIMVYPLELQQISFLQTNFIVKETKPYNMCLYLNYEHPLANKKETEIDWSTLKELNIAPSTYKTRLDSYAKILTNMDKGNIITETSDLYFLYHGLLNNFWCLGCGEEFKEYFDCSNIAVKSSNSNTSVKAYLKWCICYNKTQKRLEDIVNKIEQYLLKP